MDIAIFSRSDKIVKGTVLNWTKKYIDQEPPYLMRQSCVLYCLQVKLRASLFKLFAVDPRIRVYFGGSEGD